MALLTTYGATNKVQLRLPCTVVLRLPIFIESYGTIWQVETIERESYEYVGLTKAAAATCADALTLEYTVSRNIPYIEDGEVIYASQTVLVADIAAVPMGGGMWKVGVEKNDRVITYEPMVVEKPEE